MNLSNFINSNKSLPNTHQALNGGNYRIDIQKIIYSKFIKEYYKTLINGGNMYLTERVDGYNKFKFFIDLDISLSFSVTPIQMYNVIDSIIAVVLEEDEKDTCAISMRSSDTNLPSHHKVHLVFNSIIVSKIEAIHLYEKIVNKIYSDFQWLCDIELQLYSSSTTKINNWKPKIFDSSVYTSGLRMLGSIKCNDTTSIIAPSYREVKFDVENEKWIGLPLSVHTITRSSIVSNDSVIQNVKTKENVTISYEIIKKKIGILGKGKSVTKKQKKEKETLSNSNTNEIINLDQVPNDLIMFIGDEFNIFENELCDISVITTVDGKNIFNISTTSKRCSFVKREHTSNHQYFTIYSDGRIRKKCHDDDCKDKFVEKQVPSEILHVLVNKLIQKDIANIDPELIENAKKEAKLEIMDNHIGIKETDIIVHQPDTQQLPFIISAEINKVLNESHGHFCPNCSRDHNNESRLVYYFQLDPEINQVIYTAKCTKCDYREPRKSVCLVSKEHLQLKQFFVTVNVTNNYVQNNNTYNNITIYNDNSTNILSSDFITDNLNIIKNDRTHNQLLIYALNGTDLPVAQLFNYIYKDRIIYVNYGSNNICYFFDSHKWKKGQECFLKIKLGSEYFKNQFVDVIQYYQSLINDSNRKVIMAKINHVDKIIKKCEENYFQSGVFNCLKGVCLDTDNIFINSLDKNKSLLGFNNGIYDLFTGEFRNGKPSDYVSISVGYDYDEALMYNDETRQEILECLHKIFPHEGLVDYNMRVFSSCLSGYTNQQKIHIGVGKGSNGKSCLMSLMSETMGHYSAKMESSFICGQTPDANSPTPVLTSLVGKRFVHASEIKEGAKLNSMLFKGLCGGDKLQYRPLFEEAKEFIPDFKIFMVCNPTGMPEFNATDFAMRRRIVIIPFDSLFTNDKLEVHNPDDGKSFIFKKDESLEHKLSRWKFAFMGLLLDSYKLYQKDGFGIVPKCVQEKTREYFDDNDFGKQYIESCYVKVSPSDNTHWIKPVDFFRHFQQWCTEYNIKIKLKAHGSSFKTPPELENYITLEKGQKDKVHTNWIKGLKFSTT